MLCPVKLHLFCWRWVWTVFWRDMCMRSCTWLSCLMCWRSPVCLTHPSAYENRAARGSAGMWHWQYSCEKKHCKSKMQGSWSVHAVVMSRRTSLHAVGRFQMQVRVVTHRVTGFELSMDPVPTLDLALQSIIQLPRLQEERKTQECTRSMVCSSAWSCCSMAHVVPCKY